MFINKEGKLFGKISIVDIFVVIAIVAVALGVYSRFFVVKEKTVVDSSTVEYSLRIKNVRMTTVEALEKLGPVYDTKTKEYMGEIVGVSYEDSYLEKAMLDGSVINAHVPDRYNVVVTLNVDGKSNDTGYYTNENKLLCVGSSFVISTKFAKTTGEIMAISEK